MTYRAIIRRKCTSCNGKGETQIVEASGILVETFICGRCKGSGKIEEELEILKITTKDGNKEVRII